FIAKYGVLPTDGIALDEVAQKTMQLYPTVIRASQTTSPQAAGRNAKVAPILLHHHIRSYFGCSKDGVLGLVNGEGFLDALIIGGISIIPSGLSLHQIQIIRCIAIYFVG